MLKDLIYKNFKCFKTNTRISFGGITLFYGKNSSKLQRLRAVLPRMQLMELYQATINLATLASFFSQTNVTENPMIRIPHRHSSLSSAD